MFSDESDNRNPSNYEGVEEITHHWKEDLLGNSMRLHIRIGTGTVDKLFYKILDNVVGSSRFHQLFSRVSYGFLSTFILHNMGRTPFVISRHVVFSGESDNRNPSNYEGVEESKYNLQFLLKQIVSKLIQSSALEVFEVLRIFKL
ncbi:hypothetical protein T05_5931 [Trichinella murrelli]|uniref:Uncharacterized protein n=1 Tax=Trichinella murrelli TaxID=144512 RepID=A0A0V0UBK3_9BILA|nr:hypothetical protein T05_5931 [Trichinella murrelli]